MLSLFWCEDHPIPNFVKLFFIHPVYRNMNTCASCMERVPYIIYESVRSMFEWKPGDTFTYSDGQ